MKRLKARLLSVDKFVFIEVVVKLFSQKTLKKTHKDLQYRTWPISRSSFLGVFFLNFIAVFKVSGQISLCSEKL